MKTLLFAFLLLTSAVHADVKISQLPLGSAASTNVNDSFPYVSSTANTTQRLKLSDLINLPQMVATYAPLASPTFTGTVTAPTIVLSTGATVGYCWEATSTGGAGAWAACSSFVNPMSAVGDLIYGGSSGVATRLAANTSATKAFLTETGTGSAGQAPSWQLGLSSGDIPNNAANTTGSAGSLTQSLTANEPVIGNGTGITVGTKSGNTTDFATVTGSLTSGDCLQADVNGNIQTTGSACGSAGGGVTTVGTYNSQTSSSNGAVISGSDIYFQPFTSANPGMAPASGGGTTNFLRADGTWAVPSGGGGTPGGANTDLQFNSSGSFGGNANATTDGLGNVTLAGKVNATTANLSNLTASEIVESDSSKNLVSAATLSTTLGGLGGNFGSSTGALSISSGTVSAGTLSVADGGTGVTSVTTTPTASSFAGWDANKNLSANSFISGYATTATAAGTTTLTVSSAQQQFFTGTTTQTVVLPVTSTLVLGQSFTITNNSTGAVTVESSGANTIGTLNAGQTAVFTCVLTSGTTAASWNQTTVSVTANVTSSGAGQYHAEFLSYGGSGGTNTSRTNCTGTCSVYQTSMGGTVTVTRGATGTYTITVPAGEFSGQFACTGTVGSAGNSGCYMVPGTNPPGNSTTYTFQTACGTFGGGNSGVVMDSDGDIMCMGPH